MCVGSERGVGVVPCQGRSVVRTVVHTVMLANVCLSRGSLHASIPVCQRMYDNQPPSLSPSESESGVSHCVCEGVVRGRGCHHFLKTKWGSWACEHVVLPDKDHSV
jgi:hypothetical protein